MQAEINRITATKRAQKSRKTGPPPPPAVAKFDFGFPKGPPLIPLTMACLILNRSYAEVTDLIDTGQLRWAFDIRSPNAARREIRVLRRSVFAFAGAHVSEIAPRARGSHFNLIMQHVLPVEVIQSPGTLLTSERFARRARNFHHEFRLDSRAYRSLKQLPREAVLRAVEIAQRFSCFPQHVLNLINEGVFKTLDVPLGPKASPLVTRASVVQFLKERRLS